MIHKRGEAEAQSFTLRQVSTENEGDAGHRAITASIKWESVTAYYLHW